MSPYLTIKIIAIIVMLGISIAVFANNKSNKKQGTKATNSVAVPRPQDFILQQRKTGLRLFEFSLLPTYVELLKKNEEQEVRLIDESIWKKDIESAIDPILIDWDEISCEVLGDWKTEYVFFYDFPVPLDVPLAKYGAIYVNKIKQIYKYFTLEKSSGGYMLCSVSTDEHLNYGERGDLTKKEFLEEICGILNIDSASLNGWRLVKRKSSVVNYTDFGGGKKAFSESDLEIITELHDNNYEEFIANHDLAIVCFYDLFRGPSKLMLNLLSEFTEDFQDRIAVGKYDVYGEGNDSIRERLNIMAMPTFLFYKKGTIVQKHIGICERDVMKSWFEELSQ